MRLYGLWRSGFLTGSIGRGLPRLVDYLPPFLVNNIKTLLAEWEYIPEGWQAGNTAIKGWNDRSVAEAQKKHWPTLVRSLEGPGPLGVSHFPWSRTRENRADHNAMMSYAYVLGLAARRKDHLSLLDWGGGVGHYYLYSKALLPEIGIEYHCHDLPHLCRLGRSLLPQAHFHEEPECVLGRRYDLVLSSSSLHYFEDWRDIARKLAAATGEFLYVARLQTVLRVKSFVVVQRPYRAGYRTEYLSWFLNRQELLSCLEESGMELLREFVFAEEWCVRGAPEKGDCRGFLFRRRASPD
jgi:putative methyltransferase (TIGR04325 family)